MVSDKQVLVIEDNPEISFLLHEILINEYDVTCKNTLTEAIEMLNQKKFNLITLEVESFAAVENAGVLFNIISKYAPSTPIVLVTTNTMIKNTNPQVKSIVSKPFDINDLLSTVKQFV